MTALRRFLDRHGLDESFRAKATGAAAGAAVMALAVLAPTEAKSDDIFDPARDTAIGRAAMAERLGAIADRTNDRINDMMAINDAIQRMPSFGPNGDPDGVKARVLTALHNKLYTDTPHPELARFDFALPGVPENLSDGAAMEYAVDAINLQKSLLAEATRSVEKIVAGWSGGDPGLAREGLADLERVGSRYSALGPQVRGAISGALTEMTREAGWRGDIASFR